MITIDGNILTEHKTALYTNGGEIVTFDDEENYIGWYHSYTNGYIYSGPTYDSRYSKRLKVPISTIKGEYNAITNKEFKKFSNYENISPFLPLPSQEDYDNGFIYRYFIRRVNDVTSPIIEISEEDYGYLEKNKNNFISILHKTLRLKWMIRGIKDDVYNDNNMRMYSGVFDTNKRTLNKHEKEFPGITSYLNNLLQFYDNK